MKERYSPRTARKRILRIRAFLKFINHPLAEYIELPKIPKQRKMVIKPAHVRDLLREICESDKIQHQHSLKLKAAVLLSATSGLRAEELYLLTADDIDVENRTIYVRAEFAKDYEDRVTFFSEEARQALQEYLSAQFDGHSDKPLFPRKSIYHHFGKLSSSLRIKHMRKFFSQQSDRLGMPTAVKKTLMGHSLYGDIDLSHYDFQDEEELKKIYDKYWRDFRLLG